MNPKPRTRREFLRGLRAAALGGTAYLTVSSSRNASVLRADSAFAADSASAASSFPLPSTPTALKSEIETAIQSGLIRGAVLAAGTSQKLLFPACFGLAQGRSDSPESAIPMRLESQFDVASITKTQTAFALALLISEGKIDPDAPFTHYLPEHSLKSCDVTVRDLAMHVGGFDPSNGFHGPDESAFWRYLWGKQPVRPRLQRFEYVCYDFILLGEIVRRASGLPIHEFCRNRVFQPLGMNHSEWGPTPTRPESVQVIATRRVGEISDFQAQAAPFPIGNAGLFSTAGDLALFCQQMLRRRPFPSDCYDLLFRCAYEEGGARRSFGWDLCDLRRPAGFSRETIFHSGWSGQTYWIDPTNDFFAICLTNRFGGWEEAMRSRGRIGALMKAELS